MSKNSFTKHEQFFNFIEIYSDKNLYYLCKVNILNHQPTEFKQLNFLAGLFIAKHGQENNLSNYCWTAIFLLKTTQSVTKHH